MKTRFAAVIVTLLLCFGLFACSSKPTGANGTSEMDNAASATSDSGSKKAAEVKPLTVPAGTILTVRLGESVGSKISQPGQAFSASVAKAVVIGNDVVIKEGAAAAGTVVDAKPLGKFKGGAVLSLKLTSVADMPVETSALVRTEKGKGKRTAVAVGGGGALGAIIGGLAGGGKGAAIGALAGAGAGTAGAAYTGNKDIVLPAESAVSFKLEQPLEVRK